MHGLEISHLDLAQSVILVVDHNGVELSSLVDILTRRGYQVRSTGSSSEALSIVQTTSIDLILLNIQLLEIDSHQLFTQLKASLQTHGIPILLTGEVSHIVEVAQEFEADSVDYIAQPYRSQEVLVRVETHLRLRHLQKSWQEQQAQLHQERVKRQQAEKTLRQYQRILAVNTVEITLQEREELLELFFSQSLDGFFFMMLDEPVQWDDTIDREATLDYVFTHHRITKTNAAMLKQYGATAEQFLGRTPMQIFAHNLTHGREVWREFFDAGRLHVETDERKLDGTPIWIEGDYICLYDSSNRIIGHFGIQRDITERKQLEQALVAREQLLNEFLKAAASAGVGLCIHDSEFRFVKINEALAAIHGIPVDAHTGKTVAEVLPDLAPTIETQLQQVFTTGTPIVNQEMSGEVLAEPGVIHHWLTSHFPITNPTGEVTAVGVIVIDISDRKQAEKALNQRETQFRTLVENIPGAVYRCPHDFKWRGVYVSDGIEPLTGYPAQDFAVGGGRTFTSITAPQDQLRANQVMDEAIATGQPFQMEYQIVCADGTLKWVYERGQPIFDDQGELLYLDGVVVDISDRKQTEVELHQAKEAAEAANRVKSSFLANMSHELRTPLNIILGFTDLMSLGDSLSPEQKDTLQTIYQAGEHLLEIVNDILDLSKLEAGSTIVDPTRFNLSDLLRTLQGMFYRRVVAKGIQFNLEVLPDTPLYIVTDATKLRQVLTNLLSNAVKFTDRGRITLRIQRSSDPVPSPYDCMLSVEVADTGIGIAVSDQDTIFDAFVQSDSGRLMPGGTGLGLTISRRLARLLGGDLSVRSVLGQGSTFLFTLPVQLTSELDLPPSPAVAPRVIGLLPNQPIYRVLIADDQPENRCLVVQLMQRLGLDIREATNGQETLTIWQEWQPHLIWMDIRMPGINGYEVTRQIRSTSTAETPVIIALTAYAMKDDRNLALAAGCNDVVTKPFQENVLFKKLAEYLGLQYQYAYDDGQFDSGFAPGLTQTDPTLLTPLCSTDLNIMPSEWITALHQAVSEVDDEDVLKLITQIPDENTRLISTLTQLTRNYQFQTILQLIEAVPDRSVLQDQPSINPINQPQVHSEL